LSVEIDDSLSGEEFWPEGIPENPTLADVIAAIKKAGGPRDILQDWNLLDNLWLSVALYRDDALVGSATIDESSKPIG
jgi:hypothetical protein